MKIKTLFILTFLPLIAFGQKKTSFNKLIEETNLSLNQYSRLSPYNDENYHSIASFGLSKEEVKELIKEADYDNMLSKNKDSIKEFHMFYYLQEKITERINQIVKHPDFLKVNIRELITSDELSITFSEDKKLFNFSFDAKTGGSYRERISITHFADFVSRDSIEIQDFHSFFQSDGYSNIYNIETEDGTKYVMTGYVRGCSYCFYTFVRLIYFKDNKFIEEFMYSVESRDWNDGVSYDHETKTIMVDYHLDDLTSECNCGDEEYHHDNQFYINCKATYIFNGFTFELVEESWKKINFKDKVKD